MRVALVCCALAAAAHADVSTATPREGGKREPLLRLELSTRPNPEAPGVLDATVDAVVLRAPDGKTLWRRPPPASLAAFPLEKTAAAKYQRDQRAPLESLGWTFLGTLTRSDAIIVSGNEHIVAFARRDGRVLLDELQGEATRSCFPT